MTAAVAAGAGGGGANRGGGDSWWRRQSGLCLEGAGSATGGPGFEREME